MVVEGQDQQQQQVQSPPPQPAASAPNPLQSLNDARSGLGVLKALSSGMSYEQFIAAGGEVPDGFVDKIKQIMPLLSQLGIGGDVFPNAEDMINDMDTDGIIDFLTNEIDFAAFERIYTNNPEIKAAIKDAMADEFTKSSFGEGLEAAGITLNPEVFGETAQTILDTKIADLTGQTMTDFANGMNDEQTIAFLHALPKDMVESVIADLGKDADNDGYDVPGFENISLSENPSPERIQEVLTMAIDARAEYEIRKVYNDGELPVAETEEPGLWGKITGVFSGAAEDVVTTVNMDAGREGVLAKIREGIGGRLNDTMGGDAITSLIPAEQLEAAAVYKLITENPDQARPIIEANLDTIKDTLKKPANMGFIMDIMEPKLMGAAWPQAQDMLFGSGPLGMVGQLINAVLSFVENTFNLDLGFDAAPAATPEPVSEEPASDVVASVTPTVGAPNSGR